MAFADFEDFGGMIFSVFCHFRDTGPFKGIEAAELFKLAVAGGDGPLQGGDFEAETGEPAAGPAAAWSARAKVRAPKQAGSISWATLARPSM